MELGADLPFAALAPAFSLVTWNVGKGRYAQDKKTTATDLAALLDLHDIGCIQEFVPSLAPQAKGVFARSHQWWFGEEPSGVASISNAEPTSVRAIPSTWSEGWIVTPKMSLLTTYPYQQTQLLVANVHALNFQPVFTYMLSSQLAWCESNYPHTRGRPFYVATSIPGEKIDWHW